MNPLYAILIPLTLLSRVSGDGPPMPPHSPTPLQELEAVTNSVPAHPVLGRWADGVIFKLETGEFKIYVSSKWYDVYHCKDLVKGDWKRLDRLDSEEALQERLSYIHNNPEGFYRVIIRNKPHPPTSLKNFGQSNYVSTNRPFGGGFKK